VRDDNGYNLHRGQTLDVPAEFESAAAFGAEVCPERAITIAN
jgi:ferredoxin